VSKIPARTERDDQGYGTLLLYYGDPGLKSRRINEIF